MVLTHAVIIDMIFVVSMLAVAAYTKWHFWWHTGAGRSRMILLLSLAALTAVQSIRHWASIREQTAPWLALQWIDIAAGAGVLSYVTYLLYRITRENLHRARRPAGRTSCEARQYLEQTPWATQEEVGKLLACWDESHGLAHSDASAQPAQDTP